MNEIDLPDLSSIGVQWPPPNRTLSWTIWSIVGPAGSNYRNLTYRWFSQSYWRAYASATYGATFP
jgi:hypothetical protein